VVDPDPANLLGRLSEAYDQPIADSSAIPTLLLSQLASNSVVVALSGDGGDEAFGGYERYVAAPILQRGNALWKVADPARRVATGLADRRGYRRLGRLAREFTPRQDLGSRYRGMMEYVPATMREALWTSDAAASVDIAAANDGFDALWASSRGMSPLDRMRYADMHAYLPGDLLVKVDIASMACSLEVRSPLLDQEVLDLAARMPREMLVRGLTTKWILRQLAYRLVPRSLVDRPKRGFAIPRAAWLRGPLREVSRDCLLGESARRRGWFERSVVEALLDDHDRGLDRDLYLWPLLVVELWASRWLDGEGRV